MNRLPTITKEVSFTQPNKNCLGRHYTIATISIFFIALLYASIAYTVDSIYLRTNNVRIDINISRFTLLYIIMLVAFLFFYPILTMTIVRPKRLLSYLISGYRWHLFSKERVLFSYPVLAIIPLDFSIYSSFKNNIPSLNPFWLDSPLHKLDQVIFLGNEPWKVLHQMIGNPVMTRAIDFLYYPFWLYVLMMTVLFHALGRHHLKLRLQFFLSFIIVWAVLGNALATFLSSAGPCYFTQVTGQPSPYAELMTYLYSISTNGVALKAVQIQEWLWNNHINHHIEYGSGISAMPSIHIATTILFALSMHKTHPILEKLFYIYTFIIWVGSIHLGWHYASDGLIACLCVIAIWHYTGKLTDKIITDETVE